MMENYSDVSSGVDAGFADGKVTPFVSDTAKIIAAVKKENAWAFKRESHRSLLTGQKLANPEKGLLNRLHREYVAEPTEERLNVLLAEVEQYARFVTLGKGDDFAKYLHQSATSQYPATQISQAVTINVWRYLDKFDGRSKFSVWVYRISQNVMASIIRSVAARSEVNYLDWKGYGGEYCGSRGAASESANSEFAIGGGSPAPLPKIYGAPDKQVELVVKLDALLERLPKRDQRIIAMYRDGWTPAEIGKSFKKNAKWASNQLERIKKTLKKQAATEQAKTQSQNVLVLERDTTPFAACEAAAD